MQLAAASGHKHVLICSWLLLQVTSMCGRVTGICESLLNTQQGKIPMCISVSGWNITTQLICGRRNQTYI